MFPASMTIAGFDPELAASLDHERTRQEEHIELIASENYASPRVLEAQGSVLTNKYAEGYPGKRYYGGCEYVDVAEQLAIDRAKKLFGADYANVQPHSGSQANAAAYLALIKPGDTILGMSLDHGGHLTHGAKVNFSGKIFNAVQYGLDAATGEIDYAQVERLALEHRPKLVIAGFSAYSRVIDWARFRQIADAVGAYFLVDMAHVAGLVAAGVYPSPVPFADVVTTTTHKTLRGPRGGIILARSNDEITKKLNSMIFPGTQGGPLMHVIAAKAVAFLEALQPEFNDYQKQVVANARAMAAGLSARGYKIVSGGTDNHLFLVDLIEKGVTGKDADAALGRANITVNKNAVPNDPRSPFVTSGLRIGTPAVTTRGFREAEVTQLAGLDRGRARRRRQRCGDRAHAAVGARDLPALPGLRASLRPTARDVLPVLRARGDQGHRLAPRRRGPAGASPPRMPAVRRALHDVRVRRAGDAARGQERRDARAVRRVEAALRHAEGAREAPGVERGGGCRRESRLPQAAHARRARGAGAARGRARDGRAAPARRGGLRALRIGLSQLRGRRCVPRGDRSPPAPAAPLGGGHAARPVVVGIAGREAASKRVLRRRRTVHATGAGSRPARTLFDVAEPGGRLRAGAMGPGGRRRIPRARGRAARRDLRAAGGRRRGGRRDGLRDARALFAPGPHAALRRCAHRGARRTGRGRHA